MARNYSCENCRCFLIEPPPAPAQATPSAGGKQKAPDPVRKGLCRLQPISVEKKASDWCAQWRHTGQV